MAEFIGNNHQTCGYIAGLGPSPTITTKLVVVSPPEPNWLLLAVNVKDLTTAHPSVNIMDVVDVKDNTLTEAGKQ